MASLKDVIEESVARHDPDNKIQKVLEAVNALTLVVGQMQADVTAIKQFLNPDGSISADDQAALDAIEQRESDLAKQADDLATQAGSINTQP